jgi:nucleoside-diphosphate-sugar epimerase
MLQHIALRYFNVFGLHQDPALLLKISSHRFVRHISQPSILVLHNPEEK